MAADSFVDILLKITDQDLMMFSFLFSFPYGQMRCDNCGCRKFEKYPKSLFKWFKDGYFKPSLVTVKCFGTPVLWTAGFILWLKNFKVAYYIHRDFKQFFF